MGIAEGAEVHAAVVTDGRMGYCRIEQRDTIAAVRAEEARKSFAILGLPARAAALPGLSRRRPDRLPRRLLRPTAMPASARSRRACRIAFTALLRQVRPTRVFLPTSADLHPDHRIVHEELLISLFHAQGEDLAGTWRADRRGAAGLRIRRLLRFPRAAANPPGNARRRCWRRSSTAIRAYASQEQIDAVVEIQRAVGPVEYLRELKFRFYSPAAVRPSSVRERNDLMPGKICYLGDDHLRARPATWPAIMLHHGMAFDYVPSDEPPPPDFASTPYALYVVSDYPAARFGAAAMAHVAARVAARGRPGDARRLGELSRPAGRVSRVAAGRRAAGGDAACDDRRNFAQPCLIDKAADHAILAGLPWDQPPGIGGINAVTAKPGAETAAAAAVRVRRVRLAAASGTSSTSSRQAEPAAAAGRRPARPRPDRRAGHRRGPALGRRFGRLGRPPHRAGRSAAE